MKTTAFKLFALLLVLCMVTATIPVLPATPVEADALTVSVDAINGSKSVSGSYIWTTGTFDATYWVAIKASRVSYNVYSVTNIYPATAKSVAVTGTDILLVVHTSHAQIENANKIQVGDVLSLYNIDLNAGTCNSGYVRVSSSYGFTPAQGSPIEVDYGKKTVTKVGVGTTVDALKTHISEHSSGITVKNAAGTVVTGTALIGNGFTVKTTTSDTYTIVVPGDIDGDAQAGTSDYISLGAYIKSSISLSDTAKNGADANGDGVVTTTDYVALANYLKGTKGSMPAALTSIPKTEPGEIVVPPATLNYHSKTYKLSEVSGTHSGTAITNGKLTLASGSTSGTFTTNTLNVGTFKVMIGSWNAVTNGGKLSFAVSFELTTGAWSGYLSWGTWSSTRGVSASTSPSNTYGYVDTDTLFINSGYTTTGNIKVRLTLTKYNNGVPVVENFSVATPQMAKQRAVGSRPSYYLNNVPMRSQLAAANGSIGNIICSPTTTAMALEHLGTKVTSLTAAYDMYDNGWQAYGNWSFAAAYAGEKGYVAYVDYYDTEMMKYALSQGCVIGCSTMLTSSGHLVLVVGYDDSKGVFIVNDPNVSEYNAVRTNYTVSYFESKWYKSNMGNLGVVYVFQGDYNLND